MSAVQMRSLPASGNTCATMSDACGDYSQSQSLAMPCSVGREKQAMAEICVKAVLAVADIVRRDVNLDLIKVC